MPILCSSEEFNSIISIRATLRLTTSYQTPINRCVANCISSLYLVETQGLSLSCEKTKLKYVFVISRQGIENNLGRLPPPPPPPFPCLVHLLQTKKIYQFTTHNNRTPHPNRLSVCKWQNTKLTKRAKIKDVIGG